MEPQIQRTKPQNHKTTKPQDLKDVDNYRNIPTINVKRLVLALGLCGVILISAVLFLT